MKNTLEYKAKFFALYYGQEILTRDDGFRKLWKLGDEVSIESALSKHGYNYGYYLELKTLSKITDEDAIEVAKILTSEWIEVRSIERGKEIYVHLTNKNRIILYDNCDGYSMDDGYLDSVTGSFEDLKFHDFLRSRGYALPWMGISVEEQIEFGWVKLKE